MFMVTKEEFGQMIAEFESFREMISDEMEKLKTELENLQEDFIELKNDLIGSGKAISKKRLN